MCMEWAQHECGNVSDSWALGNVTREAAGME